MPTKGYACVPLQVRVDIDRVYCAMRGSVCFTSVWPWGGQGENVYKSMPWAHMSPYKICGIRRGQNQKICWVVGITDNKMAQAPLASSGARLYVSSSEHNIAEAHSVLLDIVGLLPECDVCRDTANIECFYDGKWNQWGWRSEADLKKMYRIPTWEQFEAKNSEEMKNCLHGLVMRARKQEVPNNSQIRETLQIF